MSRGPIHNQALALAGAMHGCWLVRGLARQGQVDSAQIACALEPIFQLQPSTAEEVYGDAECRDSMLSVLRSQLGGDPARRDMEVTRYTATLMHLERKLGKRDDILQQLRDGIEGARAQVDYFGLTHENTIGRLADVYGETVSTLRPRVMVQGAAQHLNDTRIANQIRALLLAAVRSVVLWRQCGGSRLRLILQRQKLVRAAGELQAPAADASA